jgi:hypothetical protein
VHECKCQDKKELSKNKALGNLISLTFLENMLELFMFGISDRFQKKKTSLSQ